MCTRPGRYSGRNCPSCSRVYSLSSIRVMSGRGPVGTGIPALCVITCRMVMRSLPRLVKVGRYSQTRSSSESAPRSTSRWTTVVEMALAAEYTQNGVSVVTGIFSASPGSVGALPQPCPMARLRITLPLCRKHTWMAGCMPAWYQYRAACQMRSTAAGPMSEWSSSAISVTESRSAGTRMRPAWSLAVMNSFLPDPFCGLRSPGRGR
ncbi:Uncharacterised protein [Mycobacteroides abscessus subsp. bolletii]|nr:Uncharacterised protein [Mycobacteroides abscessus subsp. bolletii]